MVGTIYIESRRRVTVCSDVPGGSPRRGPAARPGRGGVRRLMSLVGIACTFAVGCDKSESVSEQSRSCAAFCDALEKCDNRTDLLDCTEHCESDEVRSLAYFRSRADCADELSCNQWMSEVDSQGGDLCSGDDCNLNECIGHSLREEKLTEEQEHSCGVISSVLSKCDGALSAAAVAEDCERVAPGLSDNYLADSEICMLAECSKIEPCLEDLAERHSTDLRVFSGTFTPR